MNNKQVPKVEKKGGTQIRTGDGSFAGFCLTTWPCHHFPHFTKKLLSTQEERSL